jgi:hypothetical protein
MKVEPNPHQKDWIDLALPLPQNHSCVSDDSKTALSAAPNALSAIRQKSQSGVAKIFANFPQTFI